MENKKVIVLVGVPGSGKSTEAKKNHDGDWFYYSTDNYVEQVAEARGLTYSDVWPSEIDNATRVMNAGVQEAIRNGDSVIWDQTNLTPKKREKILRKFKGYEKIAFAFLPPQNDIEEDELVRRLNTRPGKTIPQKVMDQMIESFVEPTKEEGFDRIHVFNIWGEMQRQSV